MTNRKRQPLFPWNSEPFHAEGCGNTFLIYNCLDRRFSDHEWEIFKEDVWNILLTAKVDDALVLRKCNEDKQTVFVKMHVLEPDGTEADFCGNGARTVGLYFHYMYDEIGKRVALVSRHGFHRFHYQYGRCFVDMGRPLLKGKAGFDSYLFHLVDCVEPHFVTASFFDRKTLDRIGKEINSKCRDLFPRGVNVNCLSQMNDHTLKVMTYERGVYRITEACGTGSTACTYLALHQKKLASDVPVTVIVPGGKLKILQMDQSYWLGGPVKLIGNR